MKGGDFLLRNPNPSTVALYRKGDEDLALGLGNLSGDESEH